MVCTVGAWAGRTTVSDGTLPALEVWRPHDPPYGDSVRRPLRVTVQVLATLVVLALVPAVLVAAFLWNVRFTLSVGPPSGPVRGILDAGVLLLPVVVVPPAVVAVLRPVLPRDAGRAALWIGWFLLGLAAVPVLALTLPQDGPPLHGSVSFRTGAALWGTHVVAAAVLAITSVVLIDRRARTRWLVATVIGSVPSVFLVMLDVTDPRLA